MVQSSALRCLGDCYQEGQHTAWVTLGQSDQRRQPTNFEIRRKIPQSRHPGLDSINSMGRRVNRSPVGDTIG
jgi:hypothetical protein